MKIIKSFFAVILFMLLTVIELTTIVDYKVIIGDQIRFLLKLGILNVFLSNLIANYTFDKKP